MYVHPNFNNSTIHSSQDMETISKWPSTYNWLKKICMYNGILLSHKKNEILSFAATWMGLDNIIISEIGRERQILYDITYM